MNSSDSCIRNFGHADMTRRDSADMAKEAPPAIREAAVLRRACFMGVGGGYEDGENE